MAENLTRPARPVRTPLRTVASWLGATTHGDPDAAVVTGLTLDSRRVRPGDLYAALPGSHVHGADFASDAVAAGAVAVLTDAAGAARCARVGAPLLEVVEPRAVLGSLAARVYGDPGEAITLLGITGTQGKTTTTRLLEAALSSAGVRAAAVGTIGTRIAGTDVDSALTTPEAPALQALLAVMREREVAACAMEVSSHALVMGRVDGVHFDASAFLNLGRDHLDFHKDIEDYFAAKASLFTAERSSRGLTNADDPFGRRLRDAGIPMATFSASGRDADWRADRVRLAPDGSTFDVVAPDGRRFPVRTPLPGDFNVANALCAVALAGEAGLDAATVAAALGEGPGVPGRLERVEAGQDFLAVVDYAHKPDALTAAIAALRPVTARRLIVVLGAGGDRDAGKRPLMGEIAARAADVLVVTDDNPRTEQPADIRSAIIRGTAQVDDDERGEVIELGDRRAAIRHAVALAGAGDTVLVAGKGHETGQEIGTEVHPFDDRDEVRTAIAEVHGPA